MGEEASERTSVKEAESEAAEALLTLCDTPTVEPVETGVATQTELTSTNVQDMQDELDRSREIVNDLTLRLTQQVAPYTEESLTSDQIVKFYTGLPNKKVLKAVFKLVENSVQGCENSKLTRHQEFMATVMKLRLNCQIQDLAFRFNVSCSTVSRIFLKWITAMDHCLRHLIWWPDCESLQKTMPECFRASFGTKVAIIIDCFEIFIERPSNLQARASTWSSYKHHNTVKILIGIAPQGVVSFVSESWGGRVSDKYITEHSGLLEKLLPGDVVLADRGFDISESVAMMQANLHIPAFTKGKSQLSALEVTETRAIANVRIHVERVIGNVRQKYSILQSTLPIHYLMKREGEECPVIDRIVRVCCGLCNVCDSVVPFE